MEKSESENDVTENHFPESLVRQTDQRQCCSVIISDDNGFSHFQKFCLPPLRGSFIERRKSTETGMSLLIKLVLTRHLTLFQVDSLRVHLFVVECPVDEESSLPQRG